MKSVNNAGMSETLTSVEKAQLAQLRAMGGQQGPEVKMTPGKALAFDRWSAQGGEIPSGKFKAQTFRKGPMRGLTREEALQEFEKVWSNAGPEWQARYEARAVNAGRKTAVSPPSMGAAEAQKRRMAGYGYEKLPDGTVRKIGSGGEGETTKPADAKTSTASVGDFTAPPRVDIPDGMVHAVGSGEASVPVDVFNGVFAPVDRMPGVQTTPDTNPDVTGQVMRPGRAFDLARKVYQDEEAKGKKTPLVSAVKAGAVGVGKLVNDIADTYNGGGQPVSAGDFKQVDSPMGTTWTDQGGNHYPSNPASYPTASNPAPPPSQVTSTTGLPGNTTAPSMKNAAPVKPSAAAPSSAAAPAPVPSAASPAFNNSIAHGPPMPNIDTTGAPRATVVQPAPTGARLMGGKPTVQDNGMLRRVNPLTGLPMGYQPGDALPSGADDVMKGRAAQSVMRQDTAPQIVSRTPVQPVMPRGPASQREVVGSVPRSDGYQARSPIEETRLQLDRERAKRTLDANTVTAADVNRRFTPGTPEHTAAMWGVNPSTGKQLTKEDVELKVGGVGPSGGRITNIRPGPGVMPQPAELTRSDPAGGYPKASPVSPPMVRGVAVRPPGTVVTRPRFARVKR